MELRVTGVSIPTETNRKYGYYAKDRRGFNRYYNEPLYESPAGPSRVYVDVVGESFWESFANRTSRPYRLWKPLVEQELRKAGVKFIKLRWSKNAGCRMCPCSPGFIVEGDRGRDMSIAITADEPQRTDAAEVERRAGSIALDVTMPLEARVASAQIADSVAR